MQNSASHNNYELPKFPIVPDSLVEGRTEIGTIVTFISSLAEINGPWGDLDNRFRDMQVSGEKYDVISKAVGKALPLSLDADGD